MKVQSITQGPRVYVDARDLAASIRLEGPTIIQGLPERDAKIVTSALNIIADSIEELAQ